jgi:CheY-like chemotaxis protein
MLDSAAAGGNSGKTVLFVEDSSDDIDLTLRSFRKNNFQHALVVVRDGQEALDYLFGDDGPANTPHLVLLDLSLPRVSGLEVLQRIRSTSRLHAVPVIILSGSTDENDRLKTEALGADLYLRKPEGMADLNYVVSRVNDLLKASEAPHSSSFLTF